MKNNLITLAFVLIGKIGFGQTTPAAVVAEKIVQRMKDSLSLTESQRSGIYSVNLQINTQKAAARQAYGGTDSLRIKIQQVENRRDSLYGPILTPAQFSQYKQKKQALISGN